MEFGAIYEISGSGMEYQRLRLETIANNLANANTTRSASGGIYRPLEAVATTSSPSFSAIMQANEELVGVENMELVERNTQPRMVFDPGHPDANADGFVAMPNINPVDEMINLTAATRAYEANVRVLNAAKTMSLKALEIGE